MFKRPGSFSVLYGVQRTFLTVFYLISVFSLFWLIFYLLHDVLHVSGVLILLVAIAYLVLVVLGYSLIHVISYIPSNLAGAFDPLKNDIATRTIDTGKKLAGRIAEFMTGFFTFAFFDIEYTLVRIKDDIVWNPGEILTEKDGVDLHQLEQTSKQAEGTVYAGMVNSGNRNFHLYVTSLVFGDEWLGYIAVFSRQRIWKMFQHLLTEFENDFVDDQVIHVLGMEPGKGLRNLQTE